jgi:hypothetical protein
MPDKIVLTIDVTTEIEQAIADAARKRGFSTLADYLLALAEQDVIALNEALDDEEDTHETILEDFRQGWHEAMTGQTRPISELWDALF